MATITLPHPTDLIIESAGVDTRLAAHFEDAGSAREARRLAQLLTTQRVPGVEGIDVVGDRLVVSFDPSTVTRSHLELLLRTAAQQV